MNHIPLFIVSLLLMAGLVYVAPEIQNNETLKVGIYPYIPPYQYMENGELKGFEIELISEIANRMNKKVIFVESDYKYGNYLNAKNDDVDISISAITKTTEREEDTIFSNIYMYSYCSLLTNDKEYKIINDLKNKKIGVLVDSTFEETAMTHQRSMNFEIIRYSDFESLHADLLNKNIDAVYTDYFYYLTTKDDYTEFYLLENSDIHYFGIVSSKENSDLIYEINHELTNMKADGSLQKLQDKYFIDS